MWRSNRSPEVRALLWEIHRHQRLLVDIERYRRVIMTVWKEEAGGPIVALEQLRVLLQLEGVNELAPDLAQNIDAKG